MNPTSSITLTTDPAWPWSASTIGLPALALVAVLLVAITVWTYAGSRGTSFRRLLLVLALRLLALLLAVLALLRPSLAFRDEQRLPSKLLLAADDSESMTIQDESAGQSRWTTLLRTLNDCQSVLQQLQSEHHIDVVRYRFAGDVGDFDPQGPADGKRTDHGQLLDRLMRDHGHERNLRGLLVLGDGADNGGRIAPLPLAAQFRNLPCPIHTVGFGKPTTSDQQNDVILTGLTIEPAPAVPVKGEMTVKATVDAPGFANAPVNLQLLIDDQPVNAEKVFINDRDVTGEQRKQLPLAEGNVLRLRCTAPLKPGEVKVTLRIDPLPGEVTTVNNEIGSFATIAKEGISVLYVDKGRYPEPRFLCDVLKKDPRIRLYPVQFRRDAALAPEQSDLFQFDKQHYDVIILGDVSARRLTQGDLKLLAKVRELVDKRGTGLLMMGGYDSFGNSDWQGTDLERILPVQLNAPGQVERQVRLEPTDAGLRHYVLRLADKAADNDALWKQLPPLEGMTRLGKLKDGVATVYANSSLGEPLLVGGQYGSGRVLAFGGDTTHRWTRTPEGLFAHNRFWKQLVLWLAKQEESEGNAWVKLDTRRLASGSQVGFTVGLRGKGGVDVPDARFEVKVVGPDGETTVPTVRDRNEERGSFWKSDTPGEYRVVVKASGKDAEGQDASGEATGRFLVYQDTAELSSRRADHDFLKKLAATGGGEFKRPEELREFLEQLRSQPLPQNRPKTALWPEWRQSALSGFLVGYFVLFVALLCLEWFLRRRWGMV